ncbi:MAG: ATP-binding protein [Bdellovibrionota bacterium]
MSLPSDFNLDVAPGNVFFRCVEDSSEAIMISDPAGILVYVNPAWERIYGYPRSEAVGKTPKILQSGLQPPEFYKKMWLEILDPQKGSWKGELINRARDGRLVPVLLTVTSIQGRQGGRAAGYMGMAVDMTPRKELEAKVHHQDRLASVGMLASGLAHEIGTPLGVIRGRAEILQMRATEESSRKNLDVIVSQIDRISKLIRSLLRISRGFGEVTLSEVNLRDSVEEILALVGQNLKVQQAAISVDVPNNLFAKADFERLSQVLLNLVMNSTHAIGQAIRAGRTKEHFLALRAFEKHGHVVLEVQDSGCGIAPEHMSRLFRPFFTTKEVGEGTGLGLTIVAQIVREMSGEIYVKSQLGVGTTFSIHLSGI